MTSYVETATLLAVMNHDKDEANTLLATFLDGELSRFLAQVRYLEHLIRKERWRREDLNGSITK
jgi:hypothetical protein